jgi:phosphate/sulfate permease
MPEIYQNLNIYLLPLLGFGVAATLMVAFAIWWQKHSSLLSTWICMGIITIGLSVTMVVLFIFSLKITVKPRQYKLRG